MTDVNTNPGVFDSDQASAGPAIINTIPPFHGVGDVLGPTLDLFTKNFWLITKFVVVIVTPFEVFQALSIADIDYDWQLSVGIFVLDMLCSVLIAPALIYALMQVMQTGKAPGINESFRWGFSKLGKLTVSAAIAWILQALGFMLCVIPGILITLSLSLVFPIAVLEKGSPTQVLRSSHELTKGHRWKILGAALVILLLMGVITGPIELAGDLVANGNAAYWPLYAAAAIVADIFHQSLLVLSLVTYLSIRALWSRNSRY
jgi:hypothetical protein